MSAFNWHGIGMEWDGKAWKGYGWPESSPSSRAVPAPVLPPASTVAAAVSENRPINADRPSLSIDQVKAKRDQESETGENRAHFGVGLIMPLKSTNADCSQAIDQTQVSGNMQRQPVSYGAVAAGVDAVIDGVVDGQIQGFAKENGMLSPPGHHRPGGVAGGSAGITDRGPTGGAVASPLAEFSTVKTSGLDRHAPTSCFWGAPTSLWRFTSTGVRAMSSAAGQPVVCSGRERSAE